MYKIGVIGDKDSVLGFKAAGFDVFPVADGREAGHVLREKASADYAVLYITEQAAAGCPEAIAHFKSRRLPAIIPIPGNQGALGIGMDGVRKSVEQAIGADIIFNK